MTDKFENGREIEHLQKIVIFQLKNNLTTLKSIKHAQETKDFIPLNKMIENYDEQIKQLKN